MRQLLHMILAFFEEEQGKVDEGILELEQTLLNDVQEDDTNTEYNVDQYLRTLNASELKILLVIIRQTNGWIDTRTGKRKTRDRISHSLFKEKNGLCSKIIFKAIQNLVLKGLINVTDQSGSNLTTTIERKGKLRLFYSFQPSYIIPPSMVQSSLGLLYKSVIDKTPSTGPPLFDNILVYGFAY